MHLRVFGPTHVEVDEHVRKVTVTATSGSFTMLPRHVDTVAVLLPGLLSFEREDGDEGFVAVDGGIVVKVGADVLVSSPCVVPGTALEEMRHVVTERILARAEHEQNARLALARLEVDVVQHMVDLEEHERR